MGTVGELMGMLLRSLSRVWGVLSPAVGKDTPVTFRHWACRLPQLPSTTGHASYPYAVTFVQGLSRLSFLTQ